MGLRKSQLHSFLLLFTIAGILSAQSEPQGFDAFYFQLYDFFGYESAENTGLSVFPSLRVSGGGEREALGEATTAVASDISFIESNPAASSLLKYTELGAFVKPVISDVMLNQLVFTQRINDLGYGFGIKLVHNGFEAVDNLGNFTAVANLFDVVLTGNFSYSILRNFYYSGIALGINAKLMYRSIPKELYAHLPSVRDFEQSALGFALDIGALSRFNFLKPYVSSDKNTSLGLSLLNLGPLVQGDPLPTEFRLGLSYKPFPFFQMSGDFIVPINLEENKAESLGWAAGVSFIVSDFFSLNGGLLWMEAKKRFSMGLDFFLDDLSIQVNYNLDATTANPNSFFNITDSASALATINFGDEDRGARRAQMLELYFRAFDLVTSEDYREAIDLLNQAIEIDSKFNLAYDLLAIARRGLEQAQRLNEIQN